MGDCVLEVAAGRFEIYTAQEVRQINDDLQVEKSLPEFFVFGGDRSNELLAFVTRETKPWKVCMIPMIGMLEESATATADSFESLVASETNDD